MPENDATAILDRAEGAFASLGLTIARRDPAEGVMTSMPFDSASRIDSGEMAGPPKLHDRRRRVAVVRVEHRADADTMRVFCRVEIQEQTTQALRMLSIDQRPSDVPDESPIQREAATTPDQNTVWQVIRRDPAAERAILSAITDPSK